MCNAGVWFIWQLVDGAVLAAQRTDPSGRQNIPFASLFGICLGATGLLLEPAFAQKRAVVELFTSQGCSSCPAADAILGKYAIDPSVIALTMPVDYWDYLGWKDTLADRRFTLRQKAYSHMRADRKVFTPQLVINGVAQVVGSDSASIERGIIDSRGVDAVMSVPIALRVTGGNISVSVAAAPPTASIRASQGEVWICSVSRAVSIAVRRGENHGQALTYHNVVRYWLKVGDWSGSKSNFTVPIENVARDGIDAAVVYLQHGSRDRPGAMLGAAYTSLK